jgi:hypothetical protein
VISLFLFFTIQVVLSPRGGGTVTDTYHDGASFLAPFSLFSCMFQLSLLFLFMVQGGRLPCVMIQKPDGLFGYLRQYSTAFGLLGRHDFVAILDIIVFDGSPLRILCNSCCLCSKLLGILAGGTRSDNKADGLIVFAFVSLSSTRTCFHVFKCRRLGTYSPVLTSTSIDDFILLLHLSLDSVVCL